MPKILHFEDEKVVTSVYKKTFLMYGFDYIVYDSPSKDPCRIVLEEHPDLIVMDVFLPIMNGIEATALLKANLRTKEIPIFGLCTIGDDTDKQKAIKTGMVDFWFAGKYFPKEVAKRIREILEIEQFLVNE